MEDESDTEKRMVVGLIEKATNSTTPQVDTRLLKGIKSLVRYSDSHLRLAAQTLMSLMKRDHSQVRYLTLLIIDELFMRSKLFRAILVENLDHLLTLSVGFRRNLPLPAPASVASVLRSKAIEFLEKWNTSFGIHYRQLRLGYDYLKNTLRFQFPNLQANALRIQHERRERELRTKDILLKKLQTLKDNLASIKDEIQSTTDEICECLNILNTKDEEDIPLVPLDDEDIEEFRNSELRQLRHDSLKEGEKVRENTDNKVVFDALRELYRVLMTKHIVAVQEWISVLIRVETEDTRFRDSTLKDFIDIRNHLKSVKAKCEASGCTLSKTTSFEEEVIWEDGNVGSFESRKPVGTQNNDDGRALASNPSEVRCEASATEGSDRCPKGNRTFKVKKDTGGESNPLRSELLDNAPVLDWSSFLDNWGSKRDALANQRGLDLDGHWGRVDHDAVIPAEKIAELNLHMTVYREDPVEIQPCRAPLRKGGLCQRRDLRACPFHGLIIPRDDEGKPILQGPSTEETLSETEDKGNAISHCPSMGDMTHADDNLVEQLARQAVKNVRERDKGEAKQREHERQNLKRAKLAKVREHNEAVLRDAAIASSSYSYAGEDQHTTNGTKYSARNKKETLASMLKKKETVKDRLAQKLLNSRARDATQR
ncbi:UV-stimulated scaffold protein A homolog [Ipomoea triloba]|uniref:UV-stimulated scaffold protein A homolog n=1 Tax=Ipomoea triloba TaxID=35885 RepID=UPI00125CEB3B|nr:UV-stimulated scaffold protein A homolog [Ipomoea triloba]